MKLTEKEARTKLCPMMSNQFHNGMQYADRGNGRTVKCCASDCMLWRWRDNSDPHFLEQRYAHTADRPEPMGYCGLSH